MHLLVIPALGIIAKTFDMLLGDYVCTLCELPNRVMVLDWKVST